VVVYWIRETSPLDDPLILLNGRGCLKGLSSSRPYSVRAILPKEAAEAEVLTKWVGN